MQTNHAYMPLTFDEQKKKMALDRESMNLENAISSTQTTVQAPRKIIVSNGCEVTLVFQQSQDPEVRKAIAAMLLDAFLKRRGIK